MKRTLLHFTAATLFLGCASDPSSNESGGECNEGKCDGNGELVATNNGNVTLGGGYIGTFDKTASQCVQPDPETSAGRALVSVGGLDDTMELAYISSREQISRELGIDLNLKVKYGITNTDVAFNLARKFSSNTRSVNLLLKVARNYVVRNNAPQALTPSAATKLLGGIQPFVTTCGTTYVNGVRYSANLYALITYVTNDEQTAMDIKGSLGFSAGVGRLGVNANVALRLSNTATREGVSASLKLVGSGFEMSGQPANATLIADFLGTGVTPQFFEKVDALKNMLDTSIRRDVCRDAGEGDCGGVRAPGYFMNTQRNAKSTAIDLGFYDTLPNASWTGDVNPFEQVLTRLRAVERYVRALGGLQERIEGVYWNEMQPFSNASSDLKASFQVAPPANPVRSIPELVAIHDTWSQEFNSPGGPASLGRTMQSVIEKQQDCWSKASVNLFSTECSPNDVAPTEDPTYKAALAKITDYGNAGRILPVSYRTAAATNASAAAAACQALSSADLSYRLPTNAEAKALAPLIGFGSLPWNENPHATWIAVADGTAPCDASNAMPHYGFYNAPQESEISWFCADNIYRVVPICVPSSGPLPQLPKP